MSSYFNQLAMRPDRLEIRTNTACRITSRLLPLHHPEHATVSGIPGLRLLDMNSRRVRLVHLPTGGRLDLIDSSSSRWWKTRDMKTIADFFAHPDSGRAGGTSTGPYGARVRCPLRRRCPATVTCLAGQVPSVADPAVDGTNVLGTGGLLRAGAGTLDVVGFHRTG